MHIDINCDMGEGIGNDEAIMPYISSASIACGYHAGDEATIRKTIRLCKQYHVAIGAHPSFFDKANFGRTEQPLSPVEVYELVKEQLLLFQAIANELDYKPTHVKPHGALYNMSAKDPALAAAIANAVKDVDPSLCLFGLSGSHSIISATATGLRTASEVFADRTYRDDGSLTPRTAEGALIEDPARAVQQALQMVKEKTVTASSGKRIPVLADTICIHGDGQHAVAFARTIHETFKQYGIRIVNV